MRFVNPALRDGGVDQAQISLMLCCLPHIIINGRITAGVLPTGIHASALFGEPLFVIRESRAGKGKLISISFRLKIWVSLTGQFR